MPQPPCPGSPPARSRSAKPSSPPYCSASDEDAPRSGPLKQKPTSGSGPVIPTSCARATNRARSRTSGAVRAESQPCQGLARPTPRPVQPDAARPLARSTDSVPARLQFPVLEADLNYTVTVFPEIGVPVGFPPRPVTWLTRGSINLSGSALSSVGLVAPLLDPAQAVVLERRSGLRLSLHPSSRSSRRHRVIR